MGGLLTDATRGRLGMHGKRRMELSMDRAGLSAWLMNLAESFERGEYLSEEPPVDLEGFRKLKVSLRQNPDGSVQVKLSAKYPRPSGTPQSASGGQPVSGEGDAQGATDTAVPKYTSLKKHMKQTFKSIGHALSAGQLPPSLEARSFIADSRLMIEYQGKGEGYYEAYRNLTDDFEAALSTGSLDGLRSAYQALAQLKRECHSRHA